MNFASSSSSSKLPNLSAHAHDPSFPFLSFPCPACFAQTAGMFGDSTETPEIFFWIDYSCVNQRTKKAYMSALPLFISACTTTVTIDSTDFDMRAWTRAESMLAYAFQENGCFQFMIDRTFENKKQSIVANWKWLENPVLHCVG